MTSTAAIDEIDPEEERKHFRAVVTSFKYYKVCSLERIHKSERIIATLPGNHQRRLQKYSAYLNKFKECLDINNYIAQLIVTDVDKIFANVDPTLLNISDIEVAESSGCNFSTCGIDSHLHKMQKETEKVQTILRTIVRDWSELGAAERKQAYMPILDEMADLYSSCRGAERTKVKVLVPGAGLGRLAWEIAARGFTCQGNEFSLYMLFASNFILNRCPEVNQYTVYPWLNQYVNNLSCEHQLVSAKFPDVLPSVDRPKRNFSMAAGDFLKVYTEPNEWHCVVTCFFIDCAPNVIEFMERIYEILRPGGYWLNLGPLLYHYSDLDSENSIEPPYDILLDIIADIGFELVKDATGLPTKYAQNPYSMVKHEYESVFFVCMKPVV